MREDDDRCGGLTAAPAQGRGRFNIAWTTRYWIAWWLVLFKLVSWCVVVQAEGSQNKLDPAHRLSRVEASIFAESALIDKETGRIFWEAGGSQSTLTKSVLTKFGFGPHTKATILSLLLILAVAGHFHQWLRQKLDESVLYQRLLRNSLAYLPALLLKHVVLGAPQFDNWLLCAVVLVYFWEAYTCKTRRYLANPMGSQEEIEQHIEYLRQQPPTVSWKVRSFHYETPIWYRPKLLWKLVATALFGSNRGGVGGEYQRVQVGGNGGSAHGADMGVEHDALRLDRFTLWPFTRKRVTHQAQESYRYKHWVDSTLVGLWQRAKAAAPSFPKAPLLTLASPNRHQEPQAPFAKLNLSKLLVLSDSKARKDYFDQQSKFLALHGSLDDLTEFSTTIDVPGFRPLLLAVRPAGETESTNNQRRHRHPSALSLQFWFFTLLGLTVPYRIWFTQHCDEIRVTVVKETSAKKPPMSMSTSSTGGSWWSWGTGKRGKVAASEKEDPANLAIEQREVFRETMRQLELYKPEEDNNNNPARLMEPVKKIIRQLTPKSSEGEAEEDDDDIAQTNATATTETDTRSMLVQEIKEAVATAELLNANETRSAMGGSPTFTSRRLSDSSEQAQEGESSGESSEETKSLDSAEEGEEETDHIAGKEQSLPPSEPATEESAIVATNTTAVDHNVSSAPATATTIT